MRTVLWLALALATFVLVAVPAAAQPPANTDKLITRIAFGSCCKQGQPQPIWDAIAGAKPDLLVMLGDNIYADTLDMDVLKAKYAMLGAEKGFQKLRSTCPILATWDDHDYGLNDAGAEYAKKKESQQIFLDFFGDAADSPRRKREGVYDAKTFGPPGREVQIVLLDTRYFRSPLMKRLAQEEPQSEPGEGINGPYAPNTDP
ncbi:MAG: alkaline phosphatase family protein, partial [Planctomycetia bacterium]|nr:alkaline phosphatase family protein [Planctomycetia bacterium]